MEPRPQLAKKSRIMKPTPRREELPEEMLEEILSRLDAEDVCQLKVVSKGFLSILSSKIFMAKHLLKMNQLNRSVYVFQEEFCFTPLFYHVDGVGNVINGRLVTDEDKDIEILTSAGALCLYCNYVDDFYLINPSTYSKKLMPTCKIDYPAGCTWAQVFFGMGYVEDEDDYKVLRVALFNSNDFKSEVMLYSRNTGNWMRISDFPCDYPICQPGVFVCGCLHWRSSIFFKKYSITSYNLRDGSYSSFEMPEVPLLMAVQELVALDEDTLAISCSMTKAGEAHTIWILPQYHNKNSWIKVQVKISGHLYDNLQLTLQPLCLVNPNRVELLIRLDPLGCFIMYNILKNEYVDIPAEEIAEGFMTPYRFVPSLHSPHPKAC